MATATIKLNMTKAAYIDSRTPDATGPLAKGSVVIMHRNDDADEGCRLYIGFEALPNNLKRKKLIGIDQIGIKSYDGDVFAQGSLADFNKNTLTWNNRPGTKGNRLYGTGRNINGRTKGWIEHPDSLTTRELSDNAKYILKNSCIVLYPSNKTSEREITLYGYSGYPDYDSTLTPWVTVSYDDGANLKSQITPTNNKSGYLNPAIAQKFTWDFLSADANHDCMADFAQSSATFYWKEHSAGTWNQISASGSTKSVTVPANTFPSGTEIDWKVSGTDEDGTTTTSSVMTLSTSDTTAYSSISSPINTVEDGNGPITFRWSLSNAYGNDPSLVNLWWKLPTEDNQSWHVIVSSSDPITEYTTPAGYFPAGEIQWLVHAYNQDNVRGPDSQGSFICVAAPAAPDSISSDGVPYATITWQCGGQQAYRIEIDGKDYGVRFGTDKSFTLDEPLPDGEHTVSITAQGVYGLWSQPGTAVITIANTPGDSILLTVTGGADAILEWATTAADRNFFIYRDEVKIGYATDLNFTDRLALGNHSYYVINRLPSGNFTKSNVESVNLVTAESLIAAYPPTTWLNVRLSENASAKQSFGYQKLVSTRHVFGTNYPYLEMSPFEDMSGSYDAAFSSDADAKTFESLKGKVVCIKSKRGTVLVGIMETMQKTVGRYYTAYTFTVTRIHWEDFVDDTVT